MEHITSICILALLAIVFLQSGIDKVTDWKGNLGWLQSHFANSPLKNSVPLSLGIITLLEIGSGVTAIIGAVLLYVQGDNCIAILSGSLSAVTFLMLFLGQRLAKDYPGAQGIVVYFIPTVFLLYILLN
ncbi:DoxX family protein [Moheibacter sediminis]|uniref:DoxX protein n=1 Tax=Moheibacter sediminis TaxID=1434700 RepID=A0A1W2CIM9_9FLAO|nr:DoxX family protein [Moheibacter sediminis]SMC84732.1 hypothetical protein SAMN06296427_110100 [Moheibacter sediminis]